MDLPSLSDPNQVVVKKAYADTPEGQIHYRHTSPSPGETHNGKGLLPILLLHMSASSSLCFHDLMQALTAIGYSCYAPDMPGFGNSFDPVDDPQAIPYYADIYHGVFSGFPDFLKGYHIVGHHSGGVIGTDLAARHENVRSLTLIGPVVMSIEDRVQQSKTFLAPFNKPVSSGEHLMKTWEYLQWEGIPQANLHLLQRETIDHIRAWKGRSQIYSCVWAYDCGRAMEEIHECCRVLALCATDDLLWPFFDNVQPDGVRLTKGVIKGGNFGPDLDWEGILKYLIPLLDSIDV